MLYFSVGRLCWKISVSLDYFHVYYQHSLETYYVSSLGKLVGNRMFPVIVADHITKYDIAACWESIVSSSSVWPKLRRELIDEIRKEISSSRIRTWNSLEICWQRNTSLKILMSWRHEEKFVRNLAKMTSRLPIPKAEMSASIISNKSFYKLKQSLKQAC